MIRLLTLALALLFSATTVFAQDQISLSLQARFEANQSPNFGLVLNSDDKKYTVTICLTVNGERVPDKKRVDKGYSSLKSWEGGSCVALKPGGNFVVPGFWNKDGAITAFKLVDGKAEVVIAVFLAKRIPFDSETLRDPPIGSGRVYQLFEDKAVQVLKLQLEYGKDPVVIEVLK